MPRVQKEKTLIEDECLASLGFFAYSTGKIAKADVIEAFAACTRLDEPTDTMKARRTWWDIKLRNMLFAFKDFEGREYHGSIVPVIKDRGAPANPGTIARIKTKAINWFINDLARCADYANAAVDAPLPEGVRSKVFGVLGLVSSDLGGVAPLDWDALSGRTPEGKKGLARHWRYERSPAVAEMAKEAFKKKHGELFCEICGMRPELTYGHPIIDAHHRLPLSKYAEKQKTHTEPSDFAILCPNCHRAVHKQPDCDMSAVAGRLPSDGVQFRRKS